MPKVAFLCKGTRGDVLPLLAIALAYQELYGENVQIVFVCAKSSLDTHIQSTLQQESHRQIVLFHLPEFDVHVTQLENIDQDHKRLCMLESEAEVCLKASKGADLIVCNLFSLEGHFIACHLAIPCIAMSPHLQMRSVPVGFKRQLSDSHPELFQRLQNSTSGEEVGYAEVDHWMWRMFLDDYGSVCESLGLPILPFSLGPGGSLPPATPLLYGISPAVISRQPSWPESVSLCGYWSLPPHFYPTPDSGVTTLLHSLSTPPLYVGFGSMESYLLGINWTHFLTTLEEVMQSCGMSALFQCQDNGPISQAYCRLQSKPKRTHLLTQVVCHDWLFPQCAVILHHGGSGTVAASLLTGRPQIISPVMFDQNMWAEHLSWMGVAYQCPSPEKITAEKLSQALDYVAKEDVKRRIEDLCKVLTNENGMKCAVGEIEKTLRQRPTTK